MTATLIDIVLIGFGAYNLLTTPAKFRIEREWGYDRLALGVIYIVVGILPGAA